MPSFPICPECGEARGYELSVPLFGTRAYHLSATAQPSVYPVADRDVTVDTDHEAVRVVCASCNTEFAADEGPDRAFVAGVVAFFDSQT